MNDNEEFPMFPRYCSCCGTVLKTRDHAEQVKYIRNLDGSSYFDWVCKRDCKPERMADPGPAL